MSARRPEAPTDRGPWSSRRAARAAARAERQATRVSGSTRARRADPPHRHVRLLADAGRAGARAILDSARPTRRPLPSLPRHGGHL